MARIFTDEQLEQENARHVLVFAEQQRRGLVAAFTKALDDSMPTLGTNSRALLTTALNIGLAVSVASARHRVTRAGLNADAIIDGIPTHRPYMRPLGPTAGVPDDSPPLAEVEVKRPPAIDCGTPDDLPEPVPQPAKHLDDHRRPEVR